MKDSILPLNYQQFIHELIQEEGLVISELKEEKNIVVSQAEQGSLQQLFSVYQAGDINKTISLAKKISEKYPSSSKAWQILGVSFLHQGNLEKSIHALSNAVDLDSVNAEMRDHLATALFRNRQYKKAIAEYIKSLYLESDRCQTWSNLSACYGSLLLYQKAELCAKISTFLDDKYLEGRLNLARAFQGQSKLEEAKIELLNIVNSNDKYIPAYMSLAEVLDTGGESELAIKYIDHALYISGQSSELLLMKAHSLNVIKSHSQALLCCEQGLSIDPLNKMGWLLKGQILHSLHQFASSKKALSAAVKLAYEDVEKTKEFESAAKPFMSIEPAHKAIVALKKALDEEGVPFFLAFGTLLGIIRDGDLLPFDKDLDVGIQWHIPRDELILRVCSKHGFSINKTQFDHSTIEDKEWNISVIHNETDITIDLFFFKPLDDGSFSGFNQKPSPVLWKFSPFALKNIAWLGDQWRAPYPPEKFLTEIYGEEWKIPDPYFDTILSAKNLQESSVEAALYFGYIRLFERIVKREWMKAKGYCDQILNLRPDEFIVLIREELLKIVDGVNQ